MKKILTIILLTLFFSCQGQISMISSQQKNKKIELQNATRFIMIGDSWTYSIYFFEENAQNAIMEAYPGENVIVHSEGSPGETIPSTQNRIDTVLSSYTDEPNIDTYCVVMLGINDANLNNPYSSVSGAYITNTTNDLIYILDAIEAKGFVAILSESPFIDIDGTAYTDELTGSKPWNDNIIHPIILSRTPEFAFDDGQSFNQPYNLMYNSYPTYESGDNLHPTGAGYAYIRTAFVNTICQYIFTGVPPTKIEKE